MACVRRQLFHYFLAGRRRKPLLQMMKLLKIVVLTEILVKESLKYASALFFSLVVVVVFL